MRNWVERLVKCGIPERIASNRFTLSAVLFTMPVSATSFTGIRLIWHSIPFSSAPSWRAHSGVSFTSFTSAYSNEMRRDVAAA